MPGISIGLSSAFGTKPLFYLLRDEFFDTRAAGTVDGTDATPGPGTRNAIEVDGQLSIGSGVLSLPGQATPAWGDQGLTFDEAITRAAGLIFKVGEFNMDDASDPLAIFINTAKDIGLANREYSYGKMDGAVNTFKVYDGTGVTIGAFVDSTDYDLAVILRATGAFFFVKGGAYSAWTLVWVSDTGSTATLYFGLSNNDATATVGFWRVPDALWLPVPLVSDGFTDDNGTSLDAHSSDGAGHSEGVAGGIGAGVSGVAWTEDEGDLDIQSNRASMVIGGGAAASAYLEADEADILIDITIGTGQYATASVPGLMLRYSDTNNHWRLRIHSQTNVFELVEFNGGAATQRASVGTAINFNTDYSVRAIAYGQTIDGYVDGGNKITYGSAALNETATLHGIRIGTSGAETNAATAENLVIYARDGFSVLDAY